MNIYIINSTNRGTELIEKLSKNYFLKGIISLETKHHNSISDYLTNKKRLNKFAKKNIKVKSYNLNNIHDKKIIGAEDIDILIISGWQRLLPNWIVSQVRCCIVGCHGSPYGITEGKGRSPQNWAIIGGYRSFSLSIFKVNKFIDSGNILLTKKYKIDKRETIKTLYDKTIHYQISMIKNFLGKPDYYLKKSKKQVVKKSKYFPKRIPSDGEIDWSMKSENIINFINALSKPYPGAFFLIDDYKICIWSASILENTNKEYIPGKFSFISSTDSIIISCKDAYISSNNWTCNKKLKLQKYNGLIIRYLDWKKNIQNIFDRHKKAYPKLQLQEKLYSKLMSLN